MRNYRTEFVAVLSNQPQGGFITRKPTTDVLVASDNGRDDVGFGSIFQRGWGFQSGNSPQRSWDAQNGYQRGRGPQPPNSSWGGEQYYRRDQQGWGWQ